MKKRKKDNKKLIILPIFFVSLATLLIMAHVFALPKKALGQFANVDNFKKIINIGREENVALDNNDNKAEAVEDKKQVIDGQERFTIAAEGDSCHPDHYNYTPYYEMNSRMTGMGPQCFGKPDSFQELVEQALANDTDGDNELSLPWSSYPGTHSQCLGYSFASAPRDYRVFVPPGTFYAGIDLAYTVVSPGEIAPVYALHFKTPPQGDYTGIDSPADLDWSNICRSTVEGTGEYNALESGQAVGSTRCVFEEEDVFTYEMLQMIVPGFYHPNMVSPPVEEGGWFYLKLLNGDDISSGAYVHDLKGNIRVQRDIFLAWYNGATFDTDGNPLCNGYSGTPSGPSPSGSTGSIVYPGPSDSEFEGMGLVDPYRGNGIDISSYINDDNNIMVNADYQNLIRIPSPGEPSIIFDKGVKVSDGDVYAADYHGLIFQGHTFEWSGPIRGNHILYYRIK